MIAGDSSQPSALSRQVNQTQMHCHPELARRAGEGPCDAHTSPRKMDKTASHPAPSEMGGPAGRQRRIRTRKVPLSLSASSG